MERRSFSRHSVTMRAEIIVGPESYPGEVDNLSENGVCFITDPSGSPVGFPPEEEIDLKLDLPEGGMLLRGRLKWLRIASVFPNDFISYIGMSIPDPPERYLEFVTVKLNTTAG